jgi:hypothetical protein
MDGPISRNLEEAERGHSSPAYAVTERIIEQLLGISLSIWPPISWNMEEKSSPS